MEGQRCGVVSGTDLDLLMPLLEQGQHPHAVDRWRRVVRHRAVRPLLPGETGCVAGAGKRSTATDVHRALTEAS